MQSVETCPQEKPLKDVLRTLGLPESELEDLHNPYFVVWRLFLQSGNSFDSFCMGCWGVAVPVAHFWEDAEIERGNFSNTSKLAIEICQQRRLPWDLRPRLGGGLN